MVWLISYVIGISLLIVGTVKMDLEVILVASTVIAAGAIAFIGASVYSYVKKMTKIHEICAGLRKTDDYKEKVK